MNIDFEASTPNTRIPVIALASNNGYRVSGRATILSGIFRSDDDARGIAQRIARDVAYLVVALQHHVPGIVDERRRAADDDVEPRAAA